MKIFAEKSGKRRRRVQLRGCASGEAPPVVAVAQAAPDAQRKVVGAHQHVAHIRDRAGFHWGKAGRGEGLGEELQRPQSTRLAAP